MKRWIYGGIALLVCLVVLFGFILRDTATIGYGISPYQDTAMPKVAEGMGLYADRGLHVALHTIAWEDIVPSLASAGETVDVALGSVNTFLPRAENINVKGGGDVVFVFPLYVFKGAALIMRGDATLLPLKHYLDQYPEDRERAIAEAMTQLRGRTVAVPSGTPYEQMLLAGLRIAGMKPSDLDIRNVKLAEALYALRNGDVDIVGAGVTQRTEAARDGAVAFLDMETFGFAEVVGLMTTRQYAIDHHREIDTLIDIWFESVDRLLADIDGNSSYVLDYLVKNSSTKYTLVEYKAALEFQEFPRSKKAARELFFDTASPFYWGRTWDIVNEYLVDRGDIAMPISKKYFVADELRFAAP